MELILLVVSHRYLDELKDSVHGAEIRERKGKEDYAWIASVRPGDKQDERHMADRHKH
jgi:hypothetical protein